MVVGFITLDVGEQALIYDLEGRARVETGPQRIFLWRCKIKRLHRRTADQKQYLKTVFTNGRVTHTPGPATVFENPLEHERLTVENAVSLDASELVIGYKSNHKTGEIERHFVNGPTLYVPESGEWLHEFSWHGADPSHKTDMRPAAHKFHKLQVAPGQFYYNIEEVRTADDALVKVKVMLFYELKDIEMMLAETQDPMADFINCLCADVVAYAAQLTYLDFIERASDLNLLTTYPQLTDRAKKIGYEISKVVFRGYVANPKLQRMHDAAISERTSLKMQFESEQQNQHLQDAKLKGELERMTEEHALEMEKLKHDQEMKKKELNHQMALESEALDAELQQIRASHSAQCQALGSSQQTTIDHYKKLQGMGVDVNEYVLSLNPRPDKLIKVVTNPSAGDFHFHKSSS